MRKRLIRSVFGLLGLAILVWVWKEIDEAKTYDDPDRVYARHSDELDSYAPRIEEAIAKSDRAVLSPVPKCLVKNGARWVHLEKDCCHFEFGFFIDSPIGHLWYCPTGFDPMPDAIQNARTNERGFRQLGTKWASTWSP